MVLAFSKEAPNPMRVEMQEYLRSLMANLKGVSWSISYESRSAPLGVFPVMTRIAFVPVKRDFSVNTDL